MGVHELALLNPILSPSLATWGWHLNLLKRGKHVICFRTDRWVLVPARPLNCCVTSSKLPFPCISFLTCKMGVNIKASTWPVFGGFIETSMQSLPHGPGDVLPVPSDGWQWSLGSFRNLKAVILRARASESPGGPLKHRSLDPSPRVPDLRILGVLGGGVCLRIC